MKRVTILTITFLLLNGCQKRATEYYSPEISGKLLSIKTNEPIKRQGFISLNGSLNPIFKNDNNGHFTAGPLIWKSHMRESAKSTLANNSYLHFNIAGYHPQFISYKDRIDYSHQDPYSYQKIDMGKIYLTPLDMPNPNKE